MVHRPAPATPTPLDGVRVLDFTRYVVGAVATRRLADLGADVVKVEPPGDGDMLRLIPPHAADEGFWHRLENAGKSSISGDLDDAGYRQLVTDLAERAEVIVTSGNARAAAALGVDVARLRTDRGHLITCDIVPIGPDGPWRSIPAHGNNLDALAGVGWVADVDEPGHMIAQIYGGVSNEIGAHHATSAILAALLRAQRTGVGAELTVSCWEAAVEANRMRLLFPELAAADAPIGEQVNGSRHAVYQAADDRPMYLSAIDPDSWRRFCDATGHAELRDLWPKAARIDYGGPELFEAVAAVFRERTAAQWMAVFAEARVAATPLLTEAEVMTSEQLDWSGMRYGGGDATGLSGPVWWRGENGGGRPGDRRAPAPQLGADNDSVRTRWLEA